MHYTDYSDETIHSLYHCICPIIYGDYMKLPPESERYNHITQKIDFGPYED